MKPTSVGESLTLFECLTVVVIYLLFQAAKLALERGWAINLGGGFHHCSATRGGGFCAYADITIAITLLFDHMPSVTKVMIIDLDAHQVYHPSAILKLP